ncbi:transglycosylase domain-containing protein [Candidatus Kapabacteria bacterium]|nr:transglycosylase domain-containing protein [Candidatus Kapabacteria bacterium]
MKLYQYLLILFAISLGIFLGLRFYILDVIETGPIPSVVELENPDQSLATRVYSKDGVLLDYYFNQKRVNLTIDEIPQEFINGLIATEDREYYKHWGLHVNRILKAIVKMVISFGKEKEGGSTITQQLARTLYLDQASTINRKIREAYTAIQIEKRYTKDEILEMYINQVYYGAGAYGLFTACNKYFGKKPHDLNQAEIAYLVGAINQPGRFDAFKNYNLGKRRRNVVLSMMADWGVISNEDFYKFKEMEIELKKASNDKSTSGIAPHYIEHIRQNFKENPNLISYDLYKDGLTIITSLDSRIQNYANQAVEDHISYYQRIFNKSFKWKNNRELEKNLISEAIRRNPKYRNADANSKKAIADQFKKNKSFTDSVRNVATTIQCGVVVLNPKSGAVLAMVGASPKFMRENRHAKHSLNHVTQIKRQPGSSVKPFVYAASIIDAGLTPDDSISCSSYTYNLPDSEDYWAPNIGYDCDSNMNVTIRFALMKSINSVAARLITLYTSPQKVKALLQKAGVESPLMAVPALALGAGGEIRPIELATAYCTFPNSGIRPEPFYLNKVEDQYGNKIFEKRMNTTITDVMDVKTSETLVDMMKDVVSRGTAGRVRQHFDNWNVQVAGKTGTTNDNSDAWFTGYTPELVCCVWVGFDDHRVNFDAIGDNGQGGRAAGPIFGKIMQSIYQDEELNYKKFAFDYESNKKDTLQINGVEAISN